MSTLLKEADIASVFKVGQEFEPKRLPVFKIEEGSVLLKSESQKNQHVRVNAFPDKTGFECFINHVHLPFTGTRESLVTCLAYVNALHHGLADLPGARSFEIILSISENSCAIRFHEIRLSEKWLADNLDSYADDAILVIDAP